jgi:hypothetical protein
MNLSKTKPGFLERVYRESTTKLLMMILSDQEFVRDLLDASSLEDYVRYVSEKERRTIVETIFYLLPDEEQRQLWEAVRGGDGNGLP